MSFTPTFNKIRTVRTTNENLSAHPELTEGAVYFITNNKGEYLAFDDANKRHYIGKVASMGGIVRNANEELCINVDSNDQIVKIDENGILTTNIPSFNDTVAGKVLSVNETGDGLEWVIDSGGVKSFSYDESTKELSLVVIDTEGAEKTFKTSLASLVNNLNVSSIGEVGSYIRYVSETKGLINATPVSFDYNFTNPSNGNAPTTYAVETRIIEKINALDVNQFETASISGGVVTMQPSLYEQDGLIGLGNATPITFAKVATTGKSEDVAYEYVEGGEILTMSVQDRLDDIDEVISGALNDLNDKINTEISDREEEYASLANVAKTGKAEDVSIANAQARFTSTNVEGALNELMGMASASEAVDVHVADTAEVFTGTNVETVLHELYVNKLERGGYNGTAQDLKNDIESIVGLGRFLAGWNAITGLPTNDIAPELPYHYEAGDFYIVANLNENPETNYRPEEIAYYNGAASSLVETEEVSAGDFYMFTGTNNKWSHIHSKHIVTPIFTNDVTGTIQGSTNDGYVSASSGLGKVSGWDDVVKSVAINGTTGDFDSHNVTFTIKANNINRETGPNTVEGSLTTLETAVDGMDCTQVGGNGKYVKTVKQENGKVTATEGTFDTTVTSTSTQTAPTSKAVYDFTPIISVENDQFISVDASKKLSSSFPEYTTSEHGKYLKVWGENMIWSIAPIEKISMNETALPISDKGEVALPISKGGIDSTATDDTIPTTKSVYDKFHALSGSASIRGTIITYVKQEDGKLDLNVSSLITEITSSSEGSAVEVPPTAYAVYQYAQPKLAATGGNASYTIKVGENGAITYSDFIDDSSTTSTTATWSVNKINTTKLDKRTSGTEVYAHTGTTQNALALVTEISSSSTDTQSPTAKAVFAVDNTKVDKRTGGNEVYYHSGSEQGALAVVTSVSSSSTNAQSPTAKAVWDMDNTKVDKRENGNEVYTHSGATQGAISYSQSADGNYMVQRQSNGQVTVPQTPSATTDAVSKKYVDDRTVPVSKSFSFNSSAVKSSWDVSCYKIGAVIVMTGGIKTAGGSTLIEISAGTTLATGLPNPIVKTGCIIGWRTTQGLKRVSISTSGVMTNDDAIHQNTDYEYDGWTYSTSI